MAVSANVSLPHRVSNTVSMNARRISTTGVSHPMSPASTSVASIMVVNGLVVEPIIIRVSGVTGSSLPSSFTPNACR